ncbi:MAG: PAS domain S-box protein [Sulfurimicrobium sp.]|nr:PAS domain S-box protein [Sulfurimicrobium sp.]MDO9188347.1 PAS domain S-box protein [Sulfurimicrobium sp.]MDP1703422.1 PAS domain S-box protein [Sulfurimicrobium sp.]MDP2197209.1 PAS domain S-box protein [Sulfurimicrobium sp.]MDP3687395.1 PAS domain S-box protein [Sulfurimicrobium sp.]
MPDFNPNTPKTLPGNGTRSEEYYRALFTLIPDGVVIIDPETTLPLQFNPSAHQQLGYTAEEFSTLGVSNYEAEESPEATRAHIEKVLRNGRDDFETRHRRKDGTLMDVKVSVLMMDIAGKPCFICIYRDISAHKQAKLELQRSEAILSTIVDNIPAMVFLKQAGDLRFEMLNRAGEDLLGLSQQNIAGKNDYDFFPREQADFFTANDHAVLSSRELKDIPEEPIRVHNGETRFLHTRKIGIYDPAGKPTHLLGVSIDITDHKKAEDALLREHDFATSLIETAPVIILLLDTQGMIQHVNPYFEELSGYRLDEIKGKEWFSSFLPTRDQARIRALFQTAVHDKPTRGNINTIVIRSGEERDIEWNDQAMRDAEGKVTSVLAIGLDVTSRKNMEVALRMSEERLNEAQRIAQVGSWELELVSGKLFWTDEIFRLFEIDKSQFGATYEAFLNAIHPEDRDSVNRAYTHSLETRKPYEITHRLLMRDGRIKWVHERCTSDFDINGKPFRSVGTVQDITRQWQAEEKLRQMNETLEARVADRTFDLMRAKEEAERANSAKSEFLSRMSHELRTPLNAILGFGQLLESDMRNPLAPDQQDNIHEILHAGSHLLELINEILDLARIESGRLELMPEAVPIRPLVDECVALMQSLAWQRNIRLSADAACGCAIQGDRLRLRQILLNLLSNAIKYNQEGGSVEIACHLAPPGRIRINVRDSGRGIPSDAMTRLFKPFERIGSPYDGIEGTGIGLALAKKLTEAMDGVIGVESMDGEGSTFWIELPLAAAEIPIPAMESKAAEHIVRATSRTLLYIEDNPANLRLVKKIIAGRSGLALLDAHTAELGLEIARAFQPDIILLDINLPGMDGYEALRDLQNNPATCHIPVIAITANAMERDVERGLAAGFVDYLTKPIQIPRFFALLDELLEPARSD